MLLATRGGRRGGEGGERGESESALSMYPSPKCTKCTLLFHELPFSRCLLIFQKCSFVSWNFSFVFQKCLPFLCPLFWEGKLNPPLVHHQVKWFKVTSIGKSYRYLENAVSEHLSFWAYIYKYKKRDQKKSMKEYCTSCFDALIYIFVDL